MKCIDCRSTLIRSEGDIRVCLNCGLITRRNLSQSPYYVIHRSPRKYYFGDKYSFRGKIRHMYRPSVVWNKRSDRIMDLAKYEIWFQEIFTTDAKKAKEFTK